MCGKKLRNDGAWSNRECDLIIYYKTDFLESKEGTQVYTHDK